MSKILRLIWCHCLEIISATSHYDGTSVRLSRPGGKMISMAQCKTAVTSFRQQWNYSNLALKYRHFCLECALQNVSAVVYRQKMLHNTMCTCEILGGKGLKCTHKYARLRNHGTPYHDSNVAVMQCTGKWIIQITGLETYCESQLQIG